MTRRGAELGRRFQRAVENERVAQQAAFEDQESLRAEARAAREELLDDLESFGASIDALSVSRSGSELIFETEDRFLRFQPIGLSGNVGVSFSGSREVHHRLYREEDLMNKWVWYSRDGSREERTVLFDSGLEELVVTALALPSPVEELEAYDDSDVSVSSTRTL